MSSKKISRREAMILMFGTSAAFAMQSRFSSGEKDRRPNIVVFTVDDMDITSVNCYGNPLKNLTPNMDRLASQSMRFTNAHVSSPICMPCRQSMMTGLHPHSNGSMGFVEVAEGACPSLSGILMKNGYYTASIGKGRDYKAFEWDNWINGLGGDGWYSRKPAAFYDETKKIIETARDADKPFYIGVNTSDPHRPFAGSEQEKEFVANVRKQYPHAPDFPVMEPVCSEADVPLLPYLPDLPDLRKETVQYLTCVKRADDTLGKIMELVEEKGLAENTIFIFFSDHDAPMPTAKQNCYRHSTVTPLMIRWPGRIKPGSVDSQHFVSTLDIMPTLLDALDISVPKRQDGRSMLPVLKGRKQNNRGEVFTTYNYVYKGTQVFPMRGLHTKKWSYVFNPWSDGVKKRLQGTGQPTDNQSGLSLAAMQKAAHTDPAIRKRLDYILLRRREELFDLENDPYSFNNLAEKPEYKARLNEMRELMIKEMKRTGDPLLESLIKGQSYPAQWDQG
ncbi:Arylsulfatase [Limihaloglobus sulfuriphilus]|uniref:Arylsulfatase n=1 Tax=Limihaloglobus sulfuriphilus TaxID=1851148 RepID=A0A1Q2MFU9_9BACT|nr:sulfatase [Limihaloglobus sulfuriphilus]AQQ71576.1 Arylsulfatase [Limihaloglobus sulfuriphilus]